MSSLFRVPFSFCLHNAVSCNSYRKNSWQLLRRSSTQPTQTISNSPHYPDSENLPLLPKTPPVPRHLSNTQQNRYAIRMMSQPSKNKYPSCLSSVVEMKRKGVAPNLIIYNALLAAAAERGHWSDAFAIMDDMLSMKIKPNVLTFNHLLQAVRYKPNNYSSKILKLMEASGVAPNTQTWSLTIHRYTMEGNLEMAIYHLLSMARFNHIPDLSTIQSVITLATRNNFARLALDLVHWFERISTRRLEEFIWVNCLIASAETSYIEGIQSCWKIISKNFRTLLDQGLCTSILNACARHGLPFLATETLQMLQTLQVAPQEHHFAAIIEAFTRRGQLKEAFLVLDLMSSSKITPTVETTKPISSYIKQNTERIDMTWRLVEELYRDGHRLDIAAPRAIIDAAISRGDLQRGIALYKNLSDLNARPDLQTFNILLGGCIMAANRPLGDSILADMKANMIKPNQITYESTISLCLTQETYEDAFFYLEEMKAARFKPSAVIYCSIIERCFDSDDTRYQIALEEMTEHGYVVPENIKRRIENLSSDPPLADRSRFATSY